jgi:hypothetical protein
MGRDEVLGYVQQSLDAARTAPAITLSDGTLSAGTDMLSNLVGNGLLAPRDWEAQMREEIKAEYIRQYMLGRGGRGNMTSEDWGSIGGMLAEQYRYLKDFAKLVQEGKLSEAQIRARSAMYVNSAREGFERGQARANPDAIDVIWVLGPVKTEHCADCVAFADMGWQKIADDPYQGAMPGSGDTACLTNCACHLEYGYGEGL